MSVLEKLIAAIPELKQDSDALTEDPRYVRKLSELTAGALQKHCDVMQLPNGDVVVAEVKTMFYSYEWDKDKGKFVRAKAVRKRKVDDNTVSYEAEDAEVNDNLAQDMPKKHNSPILKEVYASDKERVEELA